MANRVVVRFALEALFLVAVAVVAGLLSLGTTAIVLIMAAAWLVVATVEWASSRERPLEPMALPASEQLESQPVLDEGAAAVEPDAAPEAPERRGRFRRRQREAEEPPAPPPPPPEHDHVRVLPPADAAPEPESEPVETVPEPEPGPDVEPEPEPAAEPVAAEPAPEPEPEPQPEPPVPAASGAPPGVPREWNLTQLERLAASRAGEDVARDEEWSFLFLYLREFADTDGVLPVDFDGLVRESFRELVADSEGS